MMPLTLFVAVVLLVPDLYIYFVHIHHLPARRTLRLLYFLPTLLLSCGYGGLLFRSGDNMLAHHATAIGLLAIGILLFSLPKILFMLCSLAGHLCHLLHHRIPRLPFIATGLVTATVCFVGILYGATIGVTHLQVKEVTFTSPDLPAGFDGYRILHFSDLHLGSWNHRPRFISRLVETLHQQHADLILFTGDLVNQRSQELQPFVPILSRLHAPDGVYSVLGNHDYGTYYHWPDSTSEAANLRQLHTLQAAMGWQLLNNRHVLLSRRGDTIALAGVENEGEPPFSQHGDLRQALHATDTLFTILMSHNPTHWRREVLPCSHVQLTLSGHTHAMQSILFGRSLASLKYPEWQGLYLEQGRGLYVNIGIGYVGLPFRFNARPEITVITLRRP